MLFFRSEEAVEAWCLAAGVAQGPTATMAQLWELASAWYSSRLAPDAKRPGPEEVRRIFHRAGLTDPVWDPQADDF